MSRVKLYDSEQLFSGLWLAGSPESMPKGGLRRAKGLHRLRTTTLRSRWGSTLIHSLNAHSLFRFDDVRFQGVSTELYRAGVSILSGLDGTRLSFVKMPPTVDVDLTVTPIADYLFVTGGGLARKVGSTGTVTNWGITAPPNGFTATKVAQKSKTIDALSSAASWTGSSATLADEATIKQEGTNSLRMTVAVSTVGTASKAIAVDLSIFGAGETSPNEDYISVWVRVDNPSNLEYLQIQFDLSGGAFATDFYSRTIFADTDIPPATQFITQQIGIASINDIGNDEALFIEEQDDTESKRLVKVDRTTRILNSLGQTSITTAQGAWVKLRVPKAAFQKMGSSSNTWANVAAVRLKAKSNSRGQAIIYWDDMKMIGGGGGLLGKYKYKVTFHNTVTGSRSDANPTAVEVENVERQSVNLANLPISIDSQVNQREIWRTVGNGTLFFRAGTVNDNTITTFTDNVADYFGLDSAANAASLENLLLQDDNMPPASTYERAFGPFALRMWWCADIATGAKGRVYYSPANRAEGVQGFLQLTNDDDPTQVGIIWNGNAYAWTEGKVFQILVNDEPFIFREIYGVPGTTQPDTVKPTPYGVIYQATDGVRVFDGATSRLASFEGISPIFQGEATGGIAAFEGVVADYGNDEYFISDTVNTITLNLRAGGWREVGIAANALYFEQDTGLTIISSGSKVMIFEDENVLTDDGATVTFDVETRSVQTDVADVGLVRYVVVDVDTNNQVLSPTLIIDGTSIDLPDLLTASRQIVEYSVSRNARIISVRLQGNLSNQIEIFEISVDVRLSNQDKRRAMSDTLARLISAPASVKEAS